MLLILWQDDIQKAPESVAVEKATDMRAVTTVMITHC